MLLYWLNSGINVTINMTGTCINCNKLFIALIFNCKIWLEVHLYVQPGTRVMKVCFKLNKNTSELLQVFVNAWGVHRAEKHWGLFQPRKRRDLEQHIERAKWQSLFVPRETLSHDQDGVLLRLKSERGKRGKKGRGGLLGEREGERWRGRECFPYEQRVCWH